jgi:alpha-amylase
MTRGVMFQFFEWNCKAGGNLWQELAAKAHEIKNLGTTAIWLPPAYKGMNGTNDTGYAPYDLYDLGEFDSKGSTRTKYGSREEYLTAIKTVLDAGMDVYADIVLNHKMGGDETEEIEVVQVDNNDRNVVITQPYKIRAYSKYTYEARKGQHSDFTWNQNHFNAFGYDANHPDENGKIFRSSGKTFSGEVDFEFGNYDYLMGANVDHYNPEVFSELCKWAEWYTKLTGINGFRLDAVKHIPSSFYKKWFECLRSKFPDRELFGVGEYWSNKISDLQRYLAATDGTMRLFDVPLHFNLFSASLQGREYNLTTIFDGTLVKENPLMAVTFVDNHDSQPGQSLCSWVGDWFKPSAYALILLREHGYPCLFYGDYFGNQGDGDCKLTSHRKIIDDLLEARHAHAHGKLTDYLDHPNCIAWTWSGDEDHQGSMAVILSNGDSGRKRLKMDHAHHTYRDITGNCHEPVTTDADGYAEFFCPPGSVSVWCTKKLV